MLESLIKEYQLAKEKVNELYDELSRTSDGYVYITCTRCYGSISWQTQVNQFTVQELCNEYYGDNGIVDVYTNNPNHSIESYGDVRVMSLEEMKEISQRNVSMGAAVVNWITHASGS